MQITNIDIDSSFYYGEISKERFERVLDEGVKLNDLELAVHKFCDEMHSEYFRRYALDPRRALYLGLFGSVAGLKVLDYGCGLGSLGIPAALAGAHVTFVDSCLGRLEFSKIRCEQSRLHEVSFWGCKTWQSLPFAPEKFDLIILNGILEWVPKTVGATFETTLGTQLDFMKSMCRLLNPNGRIFLAIENRFALKYLMGYPEDHTNIKYLSIMPRRLGNKLHQELTGRDFVTWTWGYDDFHRLLPGVALAVDEEYAMFPDYRFPQYVVSLGDEESLKSGMLQDTYDSPREECERMIEYLAEMGQLHRSVYSFAFVLRKEGE